jgi:hypothetical protein
MATLSGFAFGLLFAGIGYFRGLIKMLAALFCFALAAVLAKPFSYLILWLVTWTHMIPKSLVPIVGQLFSGILLFVLISYFGERFISPRKDADAPEQADKPAMMSWERYAGAILGGAWGVFLGLFILIGVHLIGNVEEALSTLHEELSPEEVNQQIIPPGIFTNLKKEIEASSLGPIVKTSDPVEGKVAIVFHDLAIVVNNPNLLERFKTHPDILRFANDPRMHELANDQEIERFLQARQYYELLDNEKIAALLNDENLLKELKKLDISSILKEVMEQGEQR